MKNNTQQMIAKSLGIRGIIGTLESESISFIGTSIKSKFGVEMYITNQTELKIITEWIQERDPKFKNHIANPYVLSKMSNNDPVLNKMFVFRISKATYIYVNANGSSLKKDEDKYYNPIYMYIFGRKCYAVFNKLSKYIKSKIKTDEMMYSIVGSSDNGKSLWQCTASTLVPRTMDTIFISDDKKNRIINHLDKWSTNEEMYNDRGLLYKTGILLHGIPGTGKSSMAIAIANYMKCGLITIDPTTFQYMNIPEIVDAIVADETKYVVLIDEIDSIFKSRDDEDLNEEQKNKTAKLLSLLDSQQSPTNVIFVATTNYYDRLDPALTRPGRFDLIEEMGNIDKSVARDMCNSFNIPNEATDIILSSFKEDDINPSRLQDKILSHIKESTN